MNGKREIEKLYFTLV